MRLISVMVLLLVSGCASSPDYDLSGKQSKNGTPVRYERLGSVTSLDVPTDLKCNSRQVRWCNVVGSWKKCGCVYIHDAEEKVRRMAGQVRNQRRPNP